jgi:hypothetical protein
MWGLNRHLIQAIDHANDAAVCLNATLARVNGKYGTLTEVDKLVMASKSVLVHTDMVVAHEDRELVRYDGYVGQMALDVHATMETTRDTLKTTQGAITAVTVDAQTANESIAALQPLLQASTRTLDTTNQTIGDLDKRIADPNIAATVANVQGITFQANRVAKDAADVTDRLSKPRPLWKSLIPGGILAAKLYACAVQHVCVD